jgi:hypothetical protein
LDGKQQACIAAGDNRQHPFCSATGRATGGRRAMWRLVPCDTWHPVLQRGVRGVQRRQPSLLQSTADGNGKHLARPILEIRHEHRLVWGELEHARARPIALRAHCRAVCSFVSLPICAVLPRTCFHFPSSLCVCFARGPSPHDASYPCGRAAISVGHAHDAGCASRLCTHLGSLRPTISGAASTSSAKCAIWRSDDQLCTVSAVAVLTSGNPRGELIGTLRQVGLQL